MTLKEHIDDIRNNLKRKVFTSEALVSEGIVRRLLDALGWPRFNPQVVIPEYPVEGGRVDFALCYPPLKPLVFIEVKQVGKIEGAEKQLFEYAFHKGVPVVILTDGKEWHFFHPSGQGEYKERKVYNVDLIEVDRGESAERLSRYLNYESICTGEAIDAIKNDYQNVSKQRQIEAILPEAWIKLVLEADELLPEIVAEKAENLCGYKPTGEQVLMFLKRLRVAESHPREIPLPPTHEEPRSPMGKKPPTRLVVIMPNGARIDYPDAIKTFAEAIEKLGIERVRSVYPNLISTARSPKYGYQIGLYNVKHQTSTKAKKEMLDRIASHLGVQMTMTIVTKN